MKRSEINQLIRSAKEFFAKHSFRLPPFAHWTPADWKQKGPEADEIRAHALGWDLTDFGSGSFHKVGLLLFTIRNGSLKKDARSNKQYAEKIMIVEEGQVTPFHYHWHKTEDIINRGGGNLVIELYNADAQDNFAKTEVKVSCDGVVRTVPAGGKITLQPGESITLTPKLYHTFYGEAGKGRVLVGEVSAVNDDATDNRFKEPIGRFPQIDEDEAPVHHLCTEYPRA